MKPTVFILPGWNNSGPQHWQSRWEALYGYHRVEQHDWHFPLRGDWITRLEEEVAQQSQVVLVAHSLGCIQVAAWARMSKHAHRVVGALLVAPGDVERQELRQMLFSWSPIERMVLPFPSIVVVSRNDPYCSFMRAGKLANDWGAEVVDMGHCGHINADSKLGDWPQGHELLKRFLETVETQ